jgi:multidrug transporter EmrE-like cation transporter
MKFTQIEFLYIIALVLIIVLVECLAQYCLKKYSQNNLIFWYVLGVLTYGIIAYLLVLSYNFEKLAIINIMWGALSAFILTLMAYFFYNETLTYTQILGIIVILFGTWLLHL